MLKFEECPECAAKPGMPVLCPACLQRRAAALELNELATRLERLESAVQVATARVEPGDVIVLRMPNQLSHAAYEGLTNRLRGLWPNNKVAILEDGADLSIVKPAPESKGT
jgi:hypothetical protein